MSKKVGTQVRGDYLLAKATVHNNVVEEVIVELSVKSVILLHNKVIKNQSKDRILPSAEEFMLESKTVFRRIIIF